MAKAKYGRMTANLKRNGVFYAKDQKVKLDGLDEETLKFVDTGAAANEEDEEEEEAQGAWDKPVDLKKLKKAELLQKLEELGVKDIDTKATNETLIELIEAMQA